MCPVYLRFLLSASAMFDLSLCAAPCFGQQPDATPAEVTNAAGSLAETTDWPMEVVRLTSGRVYRGLIQSQQKAEIEFVEVVRPEGKPMHLVVRPIDRQLIAGVERLSQDERLQLIDRIHTFRNRTLIEAGRMESVSVREVAEGGARTLRYDGDWFVLKSTVDKEMTRRCIVRIEQIFRAYRQLLPPRSREPSRLRILIYGSMDEYLEHLKQLGLSIENQAFYSSQQNAIVAGSDLSRFATRLAEVRARHEKVRQRYETLNAEFPDRIARLRQQLLAGGLDPKHVREELTALRNAWEAESAAALRQINAADRRNGTLFVDVTRQMFKRLYHEAFHAYLQNYVYPHRRYAVPRWLNEGLAQIFEDGQLEADTLRIDAPSRRVLKQLQADLRSPRPLALTDVLSAEDTVFLVSHPVKGSSLTRHYFYSWGLAYYLTFHHTALPARLLDDYVAAEVNDIPPIERFEKLVGIPLTEFESQWRETMLGLKAPR